MDKTELLKFLKFLHEAEKLKRLLRHSWLSSGRRESVAEHSWRLVLMVMILGSKLKLDTNKVIKMAAIHDLCEVHVGDHWAFRKKLKSKHRLEKLGLKKIVRNLPVDNKREILSLWEEYEFGKTEEAKLAQAADKLEVMIQHNEAKINSWNKKEYAFNLTYGDDQCGYNPILKKLRELVKTDTKNKILRESPYLNKMPL